MKTIQKFILATLAVLALAFTAQAQQPSGQIQSPTIISIVTNATSMVITNPYIVPTGVTSNLTTAGHARLLSVPKGSGLGVWLQLGSTNSTGVGAVTLVLEASQDGSNFTSLTYDAVTVATQASVQVFNLFTNLPSSRFDNLRFVRVKSIQNANGYALFVTNASWSVYR